ncbi:uncharacterized protein PHACADRAFT_115378 [Phanerochaete carnosa HHB-10118-sp]|uniref:Ras-GAP domain-containing protein n=1 Tax=Phanerochaete carnosa (strain HHB-10118-sp) TaxID=650164 RepID=K5W7R3_PHACS|nr:uncharacterized protein PHACADRAFT_115378 [Phanerochaete carnosa HHB-10118-sp]EKM59988.1 hypothetical protein PHACADRAFT_115378 [Phanerochaete carnosa HHB-10118-sp]
MPARRASTAAATQPPAAGRVHRSNGSSTSVVASSPTVVHGGSPYPGSSNGASTSGTPQQKMVVVLINRLRGKLPCYSGTTLPEVESDDPLRQTVESLKDISRDSIDIVAWALTELLEKLHKNFDITGPRALEVLQSQLFVLKVLSIAMASRWKKQQDTRPESSLEKRSNGPPSISSIPGSSANSSYHMPRGRQASSEQLSSLSPWIEPTPLDETCARYILSVMVMFLRQAAPPQERLMSAANLEFDASYHDLESIESIEVSAPLDISHSALPTSPNVVPVYSKAETSRAKLPSFMRIHVPIVPNIHTHHSTSFERTSPALCNSISAMHTLIAKFSGRVVYHLSGSNWAVVFSRIKSKIHVLASNSETDPDIMDVRLMTHCWLDRARLVQLLHELSSLLVNMRREAQTAIAAPLRTAVWNWIEFHQEEFDDAQRHHRRLEGTPERVFDILYQLVENSNKAAIWPTLTVLMCISNDRIKTEYDLHSGGVMPIHAGRKDRGFSQVLIRTMLHLSRASEVAIICILDVCRAASRIEPGEEVALQAMAYDLAHEVKVILSKWGGNSKPFWECPDEIDVALVSDALVTLFRFLPTTESMPIIMQALQPEMSDAVKISAIKACITLITESSITRRGEIDSNGLVKKANYRPKAKRYTTETLPDRELAIHVTMALWRADVHWFLDGINPDNEPRWIPDTLEQWQAESGSSVKWGMAKTIRYIQEGIRASAEGSPTFVAGSKWMMHCGSGTMAAFGLTLLTCRTDFRSQKMWMEMAYELLYRFTRLTIEKVRHIQLTPERVPAFAIAEIAFMVTLTSAERQTSWMAAQCLRIIAGAERQKGGAPPHFTTEEEKVKRYPVFEQLGDPKAQPLGRVADQKRIRKLMRVLAIPSSAHIAVWQECYWRWCMLREMSSPTSMDALEEGPLPNGDGSLTAEVNPLHPREERPLNELQDRQNQWHNLTLFLTAFGATCLDNVNEPFDPSGLAAFIPVRYLPDNLRILREPKPLLESFISELVDLLVVDNEKVRELAREALSTEAHPRIYPLILRELKRVLDDIAREDDLAWGTVAVFLEQFTMILKVVIENAPSGEELRGMDVMSTLCTVASLITRINDSSTVRLKLKFCLLCDTYLDHSDSLSIRKDGLFRVGIADFVVEWPQDFAVYPDQEAGRVMRELSCATLRTAVKLFDKLDLQPEEGQQEEPGHNVARLFIRYSGFLFKMLDRLNPTMVDDGLSEQTSFSQSKISNKDVDLRELIINGLASLISANTEFGIKHCLPMTYDADPVRRVIFAHVFARVIAKGIRFNPQKEQSTSTKQDKLIELIKTGETELALAICSCCPPGEADQIINVMLNLFDTRSKLMSLVKAMIDKEISSTETEASLFRGNSICTRFLSAFARVYGYNYLRNLIQPLIKTMSSLPPGHAYDLDPSKAPNMDYEQNKHDLIYVASAFLEIVSASAPVIPSMFREICAHIGKSVNKVWPEAKFQTLGAFIFLRFISPAIVNPGVVDVEVPPDPVLRRGLMNIAKIMQNLANNIFFGKEVHMVPLNDFLRANIVNVTRYLSEINKYTPPEDGHEEWLDTPFDETDAIVLHRFFEKHADKVGKELLSTSKAEDGPEDGPDTAPGKRLWGSICSSLIDANQLGVIPQKSELTSDQHEEYRALMSRFHHRDTSSVQHLFAPAGTPPDQLAIFVVVVSKIEVEALDLELLLYYVFKTLMSPPYVNRNFDIIFDWTAFTPNSQLPVHWLKFAYETTPVDIRQRFKMSRMLTPNALALRYMRRLYNLTGGISLSDGYTMHTSTSELLRNYPDGTHVPCLQHAFEQEDEHGEEFTDVYMRHNQPIRVPVTLRVAQTHLRIVALRATSVSNALSCRATEIIPLVDISDVYNVATGHEQNEFIIRKIRHGSTLYFTSVERDAVVKTIRVTKGSMKQVPIPGSERFSKLSNVVATLLHIGMVNIGSDNEELRVASYELLCSVCTYLDFEGKPVVPTKAIFVPGRASAFVSQLSDKLAGFAPQLTLDFIQEVAAGISKLPVSQRISCLQYMSPWVRNLSQFTDPTNRLHDHNGAKLRDCVRMLIDLTAGDQEIHSVGHKYIWREIAESDSDLINIVVDELMRAAVDGGIGSQRCETVADTMSALRSIHVRGRLLSRIRKVLGKTTHHPSRSLADNDNWNELACLTRLTLVANYLPRHVTHGQVFVPECAHFVSIVAGTGQLLVRTSVYGIVVNQLHSTYLARSASGEGSATPEIQALLDEFATTETLKIFGLIRPTPTSDYAVYDPPNDRQYLENLEKLSRLLVRVMEILAGSRSLLNTWRARWMGLVTSSAFQVSPAIQARAFVTLSILATSDVDDDLLYQMLVALKTALLTYDDSDATVMVSMLRCIHKIVTALPTTSRYLAQLFWLAVALLQSGHIGLYAEAIQLLRASLERMHEQNLFKKSGVATTLMESREPLDEVASQLDHLLGVSFQSSFSFTLAHIIFKGVRHQMLKDSAEAALRDLLRITARTCVDHDHADGTGSSLCPDVVGYFIALLPLSTTVTSFKTLLEDARADRSWLTEEKLPVENNDDGTMSRIPFSLLGIQNGLNALYAATFVSTILNSSQGDDTETEMLFNIISDIVSTYPDTVSTAFDCLQEKIIDSFASANNTTILLACSNIFHVAMQDARYSSILRSSAPTPTTLGELNGSARVSELTDVGMGGLASIYSFSSDPRTVAMIQWTAQLVSKIIE